jgi:transcription elongation factor S-II
MEIRSHVLGELKKILEDDTEISTNLEKSIFNWSIRQTRKYGKQAAWSEYLFKENYKRKFLTIKFNLKHHQNNLRERILIGDTNEIDVPNLDPAELFPSGRYAIIQSQIRSRDLEEENKKGLLESTHIGLFTCGRCKSRKTTYYEMQTRSADEPMTAFITCLDCGKKWKS